MNLPWLWRIAGVPIALAGGLIAVSLVGAATPTRDFSAVLPDELQVVPDGQSVVLRGLALDGADLERVTADLDGHAIPLAWTESQFGASLPPLPAGAYPLRMGIVHQGGVRRELTVPVVVGPFAARGQWIDSAIVLQIALSDLDSQGLRAGDLASALSRRIVAIAPQTPLGALTSCPTTIRPSSDPASFILAGRAVFERGSVAFMIPLTFQRPTRRTLAIARAGRVRAEPDDRALQVGRDQGAAGLGGAGAALGGALGGPFGAVVGGALGWMVGDHVGAERVRTEARTQLERMVDGFLPRVSQAMVLPERISLDPQIPGTSLRLRFHAPPRLVEGAGLVVHIDAQVESTHASRLPGPLEFSASEQLLGSTESGVMASPALVAALVDAYGSAGGAERDFARLALEGNTPRRIGPLELRGTHLTTPPMVVRGGAPGSLAWAVPDLALTTNLPVDTRVFAAGTLSADLASDGRRVLVRPSVQRLHVSCRERTSLGWRFFPCLSDATNAVPDAPARLTRAMPEVPLFAEVLGPLIDAPIGSGTDLSLWIRPARVELGDRSGAPRAAMAVSLTFEAR
jgi:hypothetical protein